MAQCASLPTVGGCVLQGSSAVVPGVVHNLLPWGWYGGWEQDDDKAKAALERWVMGVRSRRKWGAQGPRLTRRASLEWACRHLDPALGAGMPCVFDFGNVLVTGNTHDSGSGSVGHRGTMHDYVGWRSCGRGVGLRRVRLRASTGTRRRRGRRWRLRDRVGVD